MIQRTTIAAALAAIFGICTQAYVSAATPPAGQERLRAVHGAAAMRGKAVSRTYLLVANPEGRPI